MQSDIVRFLQRLRRPVRQLEVAIQDLAPAGELLRSIDSVMTDPLSTDPRLKVMIDKVRRLPIASDHIGVADMSDGIRPLCIDIMADIDDLIYDINEEGSED